MPAASAAVPSPHMLLCDLLPAACDFICSCLQLDQLHLLQAEVVVLMICHLTITAPTSSRLKQAHAIASSQCIKQAELQSAHFNRRISLLYCTALYCTHVYCFVTALYCFVLYSTVLFCTAPAAA
jgi:hypothetical protein